MPKATGPQSHLTGRALPNSSRTTFIKSLDVVNKIGFGKAPRALFLELVREVQDDIVNQWEQGSIRNPNGFVVAKWTTLSDSTQDKKVQAKLTVQPALPSHHEPRTPVHAKAVERSVAETPAPDDTNTAKETKDIDFPSLTDRPVVVRCLEASNPWSNGGPQASTPFVKVVENKVSEIQGDEHQDTNMDWVMVTEDEVVPKSFAVGKRVLVKWYDSEHKGTIFSVDSENQILHILWEEEYSQSPIAFANFVGFV